MDMRARVSPPVVLMFLAILHRSNHPTSHSLTEDTRGEVEICPEESGEGRLDHLFPFYSSVYNHMKYEDINIHDLV